MGGCRWCRLLAALGINGLCRPCWRALYVNCKGPGPDAQKRR